MRKIISIIAIAVVTITASYLILSNQKDLLVRSRIERAVRGSCGLPFFISDCSVSVLNTDLRVKDMVILNPANYQDKVMLEIAQIYADIDASTLLKRKHNLKDLRIDVREINIIKNKEGEFNLNSLTVVKASETSKKARDISQVEMPKINIESFELKVKKVTFKDYSQPLLPMVIEKEVNISERFENIDDPAYIVRMIL